MDFCNFHYSEEAPPGYIKSIVTKVINNITINCNNLILKYVEEDIVLSINVRFLSMQTVNNKWEPAFTGKDLIYSLFL
jgi:vacuolar protein sorting-associated protein 13B